MLENVMLKNATLARKQML